MTHRVEQLLDAAVAMISTDDQSVFKHRRRSLTNSPKQTRLPAISIDLGEDAPIDDDGASNFVYLDSMVVIETTAFAQASDEPELISKLVQMRGNVHRAFLAGDRDLGLPAFVIDVKYAGAQEPEIETAAEQLSGRLTSRWLVHYRMNLTDPD